MRLKGPDRKAAYSLVYSSFHVVAKLPFVQNKWIHLPVWIELMKIHTPIICRIKDFSSGALKRVTKKNMVSTSFTMVNPDGYYLVRGRKTIRGRPQYCDALLVTEPGTLPQLSLTILWQHKVIIDLTPSWCTCNCIPSEYSARSITPPPLPIKQNRRSKAPLSLPNQQNSRSITPTPKSSKQQAKRGSFVPTISVQNDSAIPISTNPVALTPSPNQRKQRSTTPSPSPSQKRADL